MTADVPQTQRLKLSAQSQSKCCTAVFITIFAFSNISNPNAWGNSCINSYHTTDYACQEMAQQTNLITESNSVILIYVHSLIPTKQRQ
jgi:hypothetical protein